MVHCVLGSLSSTYQYYSKNIYKHTIFVFSNLKLYIFYELQKNEIQRYNLKLENKGTLKFLKIYFLLLQKYKVLSNKAIDPHKSIIQLHFNAFLISILCSFKK